MQTTEKERTSVRESRQINSYNGDKTKNSLATAAQKLRQSQNNNIAMSTTKPDWCRAAFVGTDLLSAALHLLGKICLPSQHLPSHLSQIFSRRLEKWKEALKTVYVQANCSKRLKPESRQTTQLLQRL